MKYQLTILDKTATVDDYNEGEQGMGNNFYINEKFTGNTVQEVIQKACDFVGGAWDGSDQCYSTDIDGNQGRIDFQTLEDADGNSASDSQMDAWRKGEQTLYACYYVGFVEKLVPVDLTKVKELQA